MKVKLHSALAPLLLVLLAACQATVAERGNLIDKDKLAQLKPGASKEEVSQLLGSPTSIGTFDTNNWYYMGQRTEQVSFFSPEVTDRRVVEVDFDDSEKLSGTHVYGLQNGQQVEMVPENTPVQGHQTTLAEELFGRGGFGSDKLSKKKGSSSLASD